MKCDNCGSIDVIKKGKRYNLSSTKEVFKCKSCNSFFTPDNGFKKMRHDPNMIISSLRMYVKGFSLREIVKNLKEKYNVGVSPQTILDWTNKYSELKEKKDKFAKKISELLEDVEAVKYFKKTYLSKKAEVDKMKENAILRLMKPQ